MKKIVSSAAMDRLNGKIMTVVNFIFSVESEVYSTYWFDALSSINYSKSKKKITKKSAISKIMTRFKQITNNFDEAKIIQKKIKIRGKELHELCGDSVIRFRDTFYASFLEN